MDLFFCLLTFFVSIDFGLVGFSLALFSHNPRLVWLFGEVFANFFVYLSLATSAVCLFAAAYPQIPWFFPFSITLFFGSLLVWIVYTAKSYPLIKNGFVFWQTPSLAYIGLMLMVVVIYVGIGIVFIRGVLRSPKNRLRGLIFSAILPILTISLGVSGQDITSYVFSQSVAAISFIIIYIIVATRQR